MRLFLSALLTFPAVAVAAGPGDLVITEMMIRSASSAEWIEVWNPANVSVDLGACQLVEDGAASPLTGVVVPPSAYAVLSRDLACVVFDSTGACLLPSLDSYGAISLADNEPGSLRIDCGGTIVDEVEYDWSVFVSDCASAATCSVNLQPSDLTAAANDDWTGRWCVPPPSAVFYDTLEREAIGTPGAPNVCPEEGPACAEGGAVFTEIMVDGPASGGEWVEVLLVDGCDLQGCVLQEGPLEDPFEGPTDERWTRHTIAAPAHTLGGVTGARLLLAEESPVVGPSGDPAARPADYLYESITFSNTELGYLHLLCGGIRVDSMPYDHARFAVSCPGESCAVGLPPQGETAADNDDLERWCLPPDESRHVDGTGNPFRGTPGAVGSCQALPWPTVGEVLISEVMVAPQTLADDFAPPEWFELWNRGGAARTVSGCSMHLLPVAADGSVAEDEGSSFTFGAMPGGELLDSGKTLVAADGRCVDGSEASPCALSEYRYDGLSFTNDGAFALRLQCPTGDGGSFVIDEARWDLAWSGDRAGHSLQLDSSAMDPAAANDDPLLWCEASFESCYVTDSEGRCQFGSPGTVSACPTPPSLPAPGPGCHCDTTDRAAPSLFVFALLWPLRRRIRRCSVPA